MSIEWQVPSQEGAQEHRRARRMLVPAVVLAVGLLVVGAAVLLRSRGDAATASGLAGLSDGDLVAAAPSEPAVATDPAQGTESTAAAGDDAGARTRADSGAPEAVDEDAFVFDASYVTGIAAAVSQQVFPDGDAENVILTSDRPTGDALAAGSLVGLFDTTVLFTDSDELSVSTAAEIDRLGSPRVHILGGPDSIAPAVEEALAAAGHDVHRHFGPRQAHTAIDIAGAHFPDARTAVLVRTPDQGVGPVSAIAAALSATNLAAAQDLPILLTSGATLTDVTEAYLEGSPIRQVIVVGDEQEISADVTRRVRELGIDWLRWGGGDRFATAVEVARNRGFGSAADADVVILVEGGHDAVWPAGFLATIQTSRENGPVLLTQGNTLPEATAAYLATAADSGVEVQCTPAVTRQACSAALGIVDGGAGR